MATTDNELNDLIINDISQEEYDNLVATGQVQEGQIYATDGEGSGGGSTTGGLESVAHDSSLEGAGTTASPLKVASTIIAQINDKADGAVVSGIEEKIPSSASATNQLATKADLPIGFDAAVVAELPATGEKGIIYLVPKDGETPDIHDEYIWIDSEQKFEFIGSTAVDLSGYLPTTGGTLTGPLAIDNGLLNGDGEYKTVLTFSVTQPSSGQQRIKNISYGAAGLEFDNITITKLGSLVPMYSNFSDLGNVVIKWQRVFATYLNNGANIAIPTKGGTLARLEDIDAIGGDGTAGQVLTKTDDGMAWQDGAKGGASLPILMPMWSDHVINDMSWLRADTFSWQSGDTYKAAYEHLVDDVFSVARFAWGDGSFLTISETPSINDPVFKRADGEIMLPEYCVSEVASDYSTIKVRHNPNTGAYYGPLARTPQYDNIKTDTIGDITITYYQADDGHKICLPDQESNIVALYEKTGVARYYILDTANKQFKLPREDKDGQYLYFYVGNFTQEAIEQTAGLNAELFNGKADVSRVEVLEGYDYVVESQEPTADNNYTWYRKYKSGWVEQAGYWKGNISIAQYNVKTVDITLPIEMSDGNYYAAAECNTLNHVRVNTGYGTRVNTSTTMKVNIKEILNSTGTITRVEWYVCGQSA